jgi:hypothetical protein
LLVFLLSFALGTVVHLNLAVSRRVAAQLVVGQHIELRESGTRLRPWLLRYVSPEQLDDLAAAAGLRLRERWSGWDRRTFTEGDSMHVSLYRAG